LDIKKENVKKKFKIMAFQPHCAAHRFILVTDFGTGEPGKSQNPRH
jgi:hypothetical protein